MVMTTQQPDTWAASDEPGDEMTAQPLGNRQRLFIECYLGEARLNATEAASMAGYGGTRAVLRVQGSRLLKDPRIAARVAERMDEAVMSADECMAQLAAVGRLSLEETLVVKRNGRDEVIDARFDMTSKVRALQLIGQHHRLFSGREEEGAREEPVRALQYLPPPGYEIAEKTRQ